MTQPMMVDTIEAKYNYLKSKILDEVTKAKKFRVVPFEAGLGKSRMTTQIIGEYLRNNRYPKKRFLIVNQFKEDIRDSAAAINDIAGSNVAVGITAEEWKDWLTELDAIQDYPVVLITHARYRRYLMENEQLREFFARDRNVLIIDEAIWPNICSDNESLYDSLLDILPRELHPKLYEQFQWFWDILSEIKKCDKRPDNYNLI